MTKDDDFPLKHGQAAVAKIVKEGGNSNGGDRFSKGLGKNYTGNQSKQKAGRGNLRGICRNVDGYMIIFWLNNVEQV